MFGKYLVIFLTVLTIMHISCQPVFTGVYTDSRVSADSAGSENKMDVLSGVVTDSVHSKHDRGQKKMWLAAAVFITAVLVMTVIAVVTGGGGGADGDTINGDLPSGI